MLQPKENDPHRHFFCTRVTFFTARHKGTVRLRGIDPNPCRRAVVQPEIDGIDTCGPVPNTIAQGPAAEELAREIQTVGGIITADDLRNYTPKIQRPVDTQALGMRYLGAPPPSSGGAAVAAILKFMQALDRPMVWCHVYAVVCPREAEAKSTGGWPGPVLVCDTPPPPPAPGFER